jgi:hypothetical protein
MFTIAKRTTAMRVREALAELATQGLRANFDPRGVWIEIPTHAFLFDTECLSKAKVRRFSRWLRWYLSHPDKTRALRKLPAGVRAITKIHRAWNDLKLSAPSAPIRSCPTSVAGGSDSTIPGHLTELDTFDLQRR